MPGQFNYIYGTPGTSRAQVLQRLIATPTSSSSFFLYAAPCELAEILMLPFYLGSVGLFILVGTRESARNGGLHLTIYNILSSLITGGLNESRSRIESSLLWNHCTLLYWHAILSGVPPCRYLGTKAFRRNF